MKFKKNKNIYFQIRFIFVYQNFNELFKSVFEHKSPFKFVFLCGEYIKVILKSKSWCKMFVLMLSGIKIMLMIIICHLLLYNNGIVLSTYFFIPSKKKTLKKFELNDSWLSFLETIQPFFPLPITLNLPI